VNGVKQLIFLKKSFWVLFKVKTEFLNIIYINFELQKVKAKDVKVRNKFNWHSVRTSGTVVKTAKIFLSSILEGGFTGKLRN
jgi:hypothetical protein